MKALVRGDARHQRAGGLAALYLALAYLIAMPYFLIAVDYLGVTDPAEKVALLAEHQGSMTAINLITYVIFGIVLAVLSLTLYRRMKDGAPVMMQVATAVGLIWAFVLVASGLVFNFGMETVASLYQRSSGSSRGGLAGDRAGDGGSGRSRRRDSRRLVGAARELDGSAHGGPAQDSRLAGSGDRPRGHRLDRPGSEGRRNGLWDAADRVARVDRGRDAAHDRARGGAGRIEGRGRAGLAPLRRLRRTVNDHLPGGQGERGPRRLETNRNCLGRGRPSGRPLPHIPGGSNPPPLQKAKNGVWGPGR